MSYLSILVDFRDVAAFVFATIVIYYSFHYIILKILKTVWDSLQSHKRETMDRILNGLDNMKNDIKKYIVYASRAFIINVTIYIALKLALMWLIANDVENIQKMRENFRISYNTYPNYFEKEYNITNLDFTFQTYDDFDSQVTILRSVNIALLIVWVLLIFAVAVKNIYLFIFAFSINVVIQVYYDSILTQINYIVQLNNPELLTYLNLPTYVGSNENCTIQLDYILNSDNYYLLLQNVSASLLINTTNCTTNFNVDSINNDIFQNINVLDSIIIIFDVVIRSLYWVIISLLPIIVLVKFDRKNIQKNNRYEFTSDF